VIDNRRLDLEKKVREVDIYFILSFKMFKFLEYMRRSVFSIFISFSVLKLQNIDKRFILLQSCGKGTCNQDKVLERGKRDPQNNEKIAWGHPRAPSMRIEETRGHVHKVVYDPKVVHRTNEEGEEKIQVFSNSLELD